MERKRNNRFCKVIWIAIFLIAIILTVVCLKRDEKVEFPRGEDGYPSMNRIQINDVNTWLPKIESVYKGGAEIAYGTIELEKTQKMEIYIPCGLQAYQWRLEGYSEGEVKETNINYQLEENTIQSDKSWILQKFELRDTTKSEKIIFKRYNEKNEENYCLTIVLKIKEELDFPRESETNYPLEDGIKINGKTYTMPEKRKACYVDELVCGVIEIEQTNTFEIYLPQHSGICSWKLLEQDGMKAHESWLNLRTEEDKFLDGVSWALQKYEIEIDVEAKELHFVWYNEYNGQEHYSLTILMK